MSGICSGFVCSSGFVTLVSGKRSLVESDFFFLGEFWCLCEGCLKWKVGRIGLKV